MVILKKCNLQKKNKLKFFSLKLLLILTLKIKEKLNTLGMLRFLVRRGFDKVLGRKMEKYYAKIMGLFV